MENNMVPKLRFKGFTDPWEQCEVGDITDSLKGSGLNWDIIDSHGKNPCILYGNLYTDYGMIISNINYFTSIIPSNPRYSESGDVLIPASDTTPTGLARACAIENNGVLLGGDINILRPQKSKINGCFLSICLNANKKKMLCLIKGSTVRHITLPDIEKISLKVPCSLIEQEKIVGIFKTLDNLLTLHQCKWIFAIVRSLR